MKDLGDIAQWCVDNGITELEVGPATPLERAPLERALKTGAKIGAFIYCRNILDGTDTHINGLLERIRLAPELGATKVVCSTGVDLSTMIDNNPVKYDPAACVDRIAETLKPIVEQAEKSGVNICFECCPIMFNVAISPYMWGILFDKIGSERVGLAFDPSHLVWQFIDPYAAILEFGHKIFHVHGKDCQVDRQALSRIGILHSFSKTPVPGKVGENALRKLWWRYRLPGLGELDWGKIVSNLDEVGYKGVISIEHEDPVWEGSLEKVSQGILKARRHLGTFI